MTQQPPAQPPAHRRRIATPVPDPMALASTSAEPAQPTGRAPRRRSEPTVPVFVRTAEQSKQRFEDLASERGLTARAMFEQLVDEEWNRHDQADS